MRYYIRSNSGVTEGWYLSRRAADNAAKRANEIAPDQEWAVEPAPNVLADAVQDFNNRK